MRSSCAVIWSGLLRPASNAPYAHPGIRARGLEPAFIADFAPHLLQRKKTHRRYQLYIDELRPLVDIDCGTTTLDGVAQLPG